MTRRHRLTSRLADPLLLLVVTVAVLALAVVAQMSKAPKATNDAKTQILAAFRFCMALDEVMRENRDVAFALT